MLVKGSERKERFLIGHRDTTGPWNQNERCPLLSVPSLEYSKLLSHEVWAFLFPLKEQCTAGAADRLNMFPLTHAHRWKHTELNMYTHTSIKTCCGDGYFVPLCSSTPLFCREVRNRIHLHAYPGSFADEPPMGCRQLFFYLSRRKNVNVYKD